ncbi:MAG: DUF4276 family protein [Saezia sp.]
MTTLRIYLLVEGQTEETFVKELLAPAFQRIDIFIIPIIVRTSPGHKGGVTRYTKIKPQLINLCRRDRGAVVSTMLDFYALPPDFPGFNNEKIVSLNSREKVHALEEALNRDVNEVNFIPNIILHEYEAFLFSDTQKFAEWTDCQKTLVQLNKISEMHDSPEDIDNGKETAPSKRIIKIMPSYKKTIHGPLIACEIGLDVIRLKCLHFDSWLKKLESLVTTKIA